MQRHDQIKISLISTFTGWGKQFILWKPVITAKHTVFIGERNPYVFGINRFIPFPFFSFRHTLQLIKIILDASAHAQIKIIGSQQSYVLLYALFKVVKGLQSGKFCRTAF